VFVVYAVVFYIVFDDVVVVSGDFVEVVTVVVDVAGVPGIVVVVAYGVVDVVDAVFVRVVTDVVVAFITCAIGGVLDVAVF